MPLRFFVQVRCGASPTWLRCRAIGPDPRIGPYDHVPTPVKSADKQPVATRGSAPTAKTTKPDAVRSKARLRW